VDVCETTVVLMCCALLIIWFTGKAFSFYIV